MMLNNSMFCFGNYIYERNYTNLDWHDHRRGNLAAAY